LELGQPEQALPQEQAVPFLLSFLILRTISIIITTITAPTIIVDKFSIK
jgi:hypothetical protein